MSALITQKDISTHMKRHFQFATVLNNCFYEALRPICKKYALKYSDTVVIFLVGSNVEVRTATDIAQHSNLKRGNISVIIDNLMAQGYIIQESAKDDRRLKYLTLTQKAQAVLDECLEVVRKMIDIAIDGVPSTNLEICDEVLRSMEQSMRKYYSKLHNFVTQSDGGGFVYK